MSSSGVSLASSSSEDTDIDMADYLEVEGSLNSSAQGSDQEADEAYADEPMAHEEWLACSGGWRKN